MLKETVQLLSSHDLRTVASSESTSLGLKTSVSQSNIWLAIVALAVCGQNAATVPRTSEK
jgi:hypothetical protein